MDAQALYQLALTRLPGIGDACTKKLIRHFRDAKAVFHADAAALSHTGISPQQIRTILQFSAWDALQQELAMLSQEGIRTMFITDPEYPRRLTNRSITPPLLFYQGAADLNTEKVVAIVGTRTPTDYGRQMTQRLVRQLAQPGLLIISGLAFGIDAAAHKAALANNIPTVGILGTGLGQCYPREHTGLAKNMRQQGGLLSAFPYDKGPETFNFPLRNRLVAALCDALIVVESGTIGGSLLTADDAEKYGKKIFAVPGRLTDPKSAGCLRLIRENKARLLLSGEQLQTDMNWRWPAGAIGVQPDLEFPATPAGRPESENRLVEMLREKDSLSVDELAACSRLDVSSIAISLLNLEMQGLVRPLPGRRYRLSR